MQSTRLTMLTSALLVRPVDATELPVASFFYFAMGVFTPGAVIGFLMGILMMMCLKSNKKEDDKPKKQDYLPEAEPTETKPKEQEYLQYVFAPKPDPNMVCMVTNNGYHKSHTYHTKMCRSMFSEPDSAGNKIQYDFVQLELCKNCRYLEQVAVRQTKR